MHLFDMESSPMLSHVMVDVLNLEADDELGEEGDTFGKL